MKNFNRTIDCKSSELSKYRSLSAILSLLVLFFASEMKAQGPCMGITFSFEHYEPCKFRAQYDNSTDCFIEIRYVLANGEFTSWNVNSAAGFTVDVISPSELWVHHVNGFLPLGNQVPLLFTLPNDLNTTVNIAYLDDCAQLGCEILGGIPIESCPDPQDASIIGVKYRECGSLPYSNQTVIPDWTVQLLDIDDNVIGEQVTDVDGNYAFYDLPHGIYVVKELSQPGWSPSVPASGKYTVDLAPSQQLERNFGNCPGCSCDSIYMDVVQLPVSSDTCKYEMSVTNTGAYCFTRFDIRITTGSITNVSPAVGWSFVQPDSKHVQLIPPSNYIPIANFQPGVFSITGSANQQITVSTSYIENGIPVSCARDFSYQCPPASSPAPCCPAGSSFGNELVLNGDFQMGNQDFTNDYTYFNPGGPTMIGKYSVLNQGQVFAANSQWACSDHTLIGGNMLIVDGYGGPIAWQQSVNVVAGTTYAYSAWVNNLVIPTRNYADPQMALFADNNQVAGPLNLPEIPDQWVRLCGTFTATTTGALVLSIRMLSTASIGNDVAIDDVSFRACIPPPPCQVSINATQNPDCSVTVCAVTTGAQPVAYQWCDGRTDACFTAGQTPCVPTTYCVTATCADGTTSSATIVYTVQDNTPPVAVCNFGTGLDLGAACTFQVTPAFVDGGSTDNCGIQSMSVSPTVLQACTNNVVTLTVTDWCGNTSTCTMGIQTAETVPPTITNCPDPITIGGFINPNGICTGTLMPPTVSATDNCPGVVTVTNDAPLGGIFPTGTTIVTYTATDLCGNTATCTWPVTVICLPSNCASCPPPSSSGNNLVLNGDFELGNNGQFLSGYPYFPNGGPTQIGYYSVLTSSEVFTANSQWACTDHSSGTQMLIVDGVNSSSDVAWATVSPIGVALNSNYAFCAYINNLVIPSKDFDDPIISVWINNTQVGPTVTLPENPDVWIPIGGIWNSGSWSAATIEIRVGQTSVIGSDFAIDDITFSACNSAPCTADYSIEDNGCGNFNFTGFANGVPPYTYCWDFDNNPATCESTQQSPIWQFPTCGTYNVCLTIYDAAGCSATYCQPITVVDNTPPVALCNLGIGVTLDPNCMYQVTPAFVDAGSTDNCLIQSMSVNPAVITGCGNTIVTLTVTDWCNNTSTCNMGIQTLEVVPPIMSCPPNTTLNGIIDPAGNCSAVFQPTYPVANDNCDPSVTVTNNAPPVLQQGANTIIWTATDDCGNQTTCIQIVTVQCGCECGSFSNLFARPTVGAQSIPLSCGGMYNFGCPNPGQSIPITGKFECQGNNCPATSQIDWALTQPNGNVINGTIVSGPYFFLPILPLQYAQTGTYTLVLQSNCGGTDCPPCVINFNVDCPDPCPCDVPQFEKDVNQGFASALWATSCKGCFSPVALNDCDMVQWQINGGPTLAMTNGNQSFCHTFTGAGTYTVTMIVSRKKSNGDPCETFVFTKSVSVTCILNPICDDSIFDNPDFDEGAVAGGLNSGGASTGWLSPWGDPLVHAKDGMKWGIILTGNIDTADVLSTDSSKCLEKNTGQLMLRGSINKSRSNIKRCHIFFNREEDYTFNVFNPEKCFRIADIDMTPYDTSEFELEIPYDLSDWAAQDICGDAPHGVLIRPIFYMTSSLGNDQGGEETLAEMFLDAICMDDQLVAVHNPSSRSNLRIYPNPNPGTFTVELPEAAEEDMNFRIVGLTGQLLREQMTQTGLTTQTVHANNLPAGLYFLQVISNGKVLAVEKFVKQ